MSTTSNKTKIWRIVIVAILVIVAIGLAIAAYVHSDYCNPHARITARAQVDMLSYTLAEYKKDVGKYPSTVEGLNALILNPGVPGWKGPYLKKPFLPKDPWHNPYHYSSPGAHGDFDLFSYGADNVIGGEGDDKDITNW